MKKFAKTKFLLSLFVSVLTVLFMVSVGTVQAAAAKEVDVITEFKIQNAQGEELATSLGRYDSFRLNAKFALEGKNVKAGESLSMDQSISSLRILKSTTQSLVKRLPMQKLTQKLVRLS